MMPEYIGPAKAGPMYSQPSKFFVAVGDGVSVDVDTTGVGVG